MADMEESAMEEENNVTSNVRADTDTEAEPEDLVPKRGNRNSIVWLWFKKSDTDQTTVICKTCRQQVVTSDSNTSNLFYHLKTRRDIYPYWDIKLAISGYKMLSISYSTTWGMCINTLCSLPLSVLFSLISRGCKLLKKTPEFS